MRTIIFLVALWLYVFPGYAEGVTADSCSQGDVQTAINSSSDGDTVIIPTGECTWQAAVYMNKAITLQGSSGTTITNSCNIDWAGCLSSNYSSGDRRITGIGFSGPGDDSREFNILIAGLGRWRIDNNIFDNITTAIRIQTNDNGAWGVIDNNTFQARASNSEVIQLNGDSQSAGIEAWTNIDTYGTVNAVYIEDNTFSKDDGLAANGHAVVAFQGTRFVVRYNDIQNMNIDAHGF